jgi:hypothetical protein
MVNVLCLIILIIINFASLPILIFFFDLGLGIILWLIFTALLGAYLSSSKKRAEKIG